MPQAAVAAASRFPCTASAATTAMRISICLYFRSNDGHPHRRIPRPLNLRDQAAREKGAASATGSTFPVHDAASSPNYPMPCWGGGEGERRADGEEDAWGLGGVNKGRDGRGGGRRSVWKEVRERRGRDLPGEKGAHGGGG
jgi:hypothetical protein